jgi:prophage regulatory protein
MAPHQRLRSWHCKSMKDSGQPKEPCGNCSKGMTHKLERLITRHELRQMVPYTPQHILRLEKDGKFPRRVQLGANRVAWLLSEVEAWVATRVAERDAVVR